jgi:SAM-dependent methyltransferase
MNTVDHCTACGSTNIKKNAASHSSFVIDRMTAAETQSLSHTPCEALTCLDCGIITSSTRFDRDEEDRFYKNYGEPEYLNHRVSYEGHGIAGVFQNFVSEHYISRRKSETSNFLKDKVDFNKIETMLDLGGGTGNMIPDDFALSKKYVLDSSKKTPANGVISIDDINSIGQVDFILCAHTLEHVSYPKDFLKFLISCVKENGLVYVEVPKEWRENSEGYFFHEHINLFSMESLKNVLKEFLHIDAETNLDGNTVIAVLGRKK